MLIWTNLKQLASKVSFPNRSCAQFFGNTKGTGTSFQAAVFVEFFDEIFSFVVWHKLAEFH